MAHAGTYRMKKVSAYFINRLDGCEKDIGDLKTTFRDLGVRCCDISFIQSYESLKEEVNKEESQHNDTPTFVFFYGSGNGENLYIDQKCEKIVSYKKFAEAFSMKKDSDSALMLFTHTCFQKRSPQTDLSYVSDANIWNVFHVYAKVNGQCNNGSLLTKAILEELQKMREKVDIFNFAYTVISKIREFKKADKHNVYMPNARYYGVCKRFFLDPSRKQGYLEVLPDPADATESFLKNLDSIGLHQGKPPNYKDKDNVLLDSGVDLDDPIPRVTDDEPKPGFSGTIQSATSRSIECQTTIVNPTDYQHRLEKITQQHQRDSTNESMETLQGTESKYGKPKDNEADEKNSVFNILNMLGLWEYYPQNITLQMVMQKPPDKLDRVEDIPWYVMQKLIMLDYRGRHVNKLTGGILNTNPSNSNESPTANHSKTNEKEKLQGNQTRDAAVKTFLQKFRKKPDKVKQASLPHPLDVIVAIFLCSSDFLRQILAEKMYLCHVSIPVLLPDYYKIDITFLLWTLRNVIGEWEAPNGKSIETPVVSHDLPVVTFMRLGEVSRSKSKLLNDIISSEGHNTFFHKDLSLDMMPPKISNGLAEVTWVFPSYSKQSNLNEAITFINLHGDSGILHEQRQFLKGISSVLVVMVSSTELQNSNLISHLEDFTNSSKRVLVIFCEGFSSHSNKNEDAFEMFASEFKGNLEMLTPIFDFDDGKVKTTEQLTAETTEAISECIKSEKTFRLEKIDNFHTQNKISVDEDSEKNRSGKKLAEDVYKCIDVEHLDQTKTKKLPLQAIWLKLGKNEKQEHRATNDYQSSIANKQKRELRAEQLQLCHNSSDLLTTFLSGLLVEEQYKGQTEEQSKRHFFLRWLSLYLDISSRRTLPELRKGYKKTLADISRLNKKDVDSLRTQELQNTLVEIEKKLNLSSFGLEHLMREIGQVYEAVTISPNLTSKSTTTEKKPITRHNPGQASEVESVTSKMKKLPRIMAELMLSRHPLEVIDGDASHLPISWVTAVLEELERLVGDKKIFVLSVLGVQSSGKSTLLNTMFGLQFAVSAGRCTRGVYAQLVPFPNGESKSPYDYILVVDTEGLRAPELGLKEYQHDNELATFAVGIADMTLINIKGENPAEMKDVLEIVVLALLRMRIVNRSLHLQPSCFFLHQNVGAVNAKDKLMVAQQKLKHNLDQMTGAAASQENFPEICSFKDVIDFDAEKNIWYFSDLWKGDPPMAPTNPGYSENVSRLKKAILDDVMTKKKMKSKLSDIRTRVQDLWRGILAENFVFSYKNNREVRAYRSLEATLNDLFWSLEKCAQEWFTNYHNKIMSSVSKLDQLTEMLSTNFSAKFSKLYDEATTDLMKFFDASDDREIIEQWKTKSIIKLKEKKEELERYMSKEIQKASNLRKAQLHHIGEIERYKTDIQKRAEDLAVSLRNQQRMISDQELEREFTEMWNKWLKTLPNSDFKDEEPCDMAKTFEKVILEKSKEDLALLKRKLETNKLDIPVQKIWGNFNITEKHISIQKYVGFIENTRIGEFISKYNDKVSFQFCQEKVEHEIMRSSADIEKYVNSLRGSHISKQQVEMLIQKPLTIISTINNSKLPFKLTSEFKIDFLIFISRYAIQVFINIKAEYRRETDPKEFITRTHKGQLLELFKCIYKNTENEIMVADMLASYLMEPIDKAVVEKTLVELADDVRNNHSFLHSKGGLLKSVLTSMLERENFDEYLSYLRNIQEFLKEWIKRCVNKYIFDRQPSKYVELAVIQIESLSEVIKQDAEKAAKDSFCENDFRKWLEKFHESLNGKLTLTLNDLSMLFQKDVNSVASFKDHFIKKLDSVQKELKQRAERVSAKDLEQQRDAFYTRIERQCLGCTEQCPFCRAPCSFTVPDHDKEHSALQHYPDGAGRFRWKTTKELCIETCSINVASDSKFRNADTSFEWHPYKEYKKYYPNWDIQADPSMGASLYWKWFMVKFGSQLAKECKAKDPNIPEGWKSITKSEALDSLEG